MKKLLVTLLILSIFLVSGINGCVPSSPFELDIRTTKDTYQVGESLEGSEYYLKYEGESFKGMVLYSKSTEGFSKKLYSATRGTIQTGDFDNPQTLFGLKVSMYSIDGKGNPNSFDCNGNYEYSISVYDCKSIDEAFGADDCGKGGWPPTIELKEIVAAVSPLETKSKIIPVTCPEGVTDCCENWALRCSIDWSCLEGYECKEYNCVPVGEKIDI